MPFWKKTLLIILVTTFCVCTVLFVRLYWQEYNIPDRINMFFSYQLEKAALSIAEDTAEEDWPNWVAIFIAKVNDRNPDIASDQADNQTDIPEVIEKYADLYAQNKDLVGWIKIDDTKIDYPVMQTKGDPEYYLHRDFEGKYQYGGTPFMDPNSDILYPSANFLIYGHNMINNSLFGQLPDYYYKSFYDKHQIIYFDTIYGAGTYEVMAVFLSQIYSTNEDVFKYYQWGMIDNESDFNYYIENIKNFQYMTPV